MRPTRVRLLVVALAASIVGPVVVSDPALATPSVVCAESHAAEVARKSLRIKFRNEASTFAQATARATTMRAKAQATQAAILADPASTASAAGTAAADVAYPTRILEIAAAARAELIEDRATITRCGLPSMRRLTARADDRVVHYIIDSATAFRKQGRTYLTWDRISRDAAAPGSADATRWAGRVKADELIITSIDQLIRTMRRRLS